MPISSGLGSSGTAADCQRRTVTARWQWPQSQWQPSGYAATGCGGLQAHCLQAEIGLLVVDSDVEGGSGNSKHPRIYEYEEVSEMAEARVKLIRLRSSLVGVNRGAECALTVQYLERDSSDPSRMTFMPVGGPVTVMVGLVPCQ